MAEYLPDEQTQQLISEITKKRSQWRLDRQPHESVWFTNAAFDRGQQYVEWNDKFQRLLVPPAPPHRVRMKANRIQAKNRARLAKFIKNRPKPIVVPATSEYDDYLNARATQRAIDYQWRRLRQELLLKRALIWARNCSKGYWWYHWNPALMARVLTHDPQTGQNVYREEALGDIELEVGSSFEVLVADAGISQISEQPEIMRVKLRDIEDMKARYADYAPYLKAESGNNELFRFERNIATLNQLGTVGTSPTGKTRGDDNRWVLVSEHFIRPGGKFPKGAYRVLIGNVLVKNQDELPYGFHDLANPFPVTEFSDMHIEGQYWSPTITEQLVDLQKEFNLMLSKVGEHIRVAAFPKVFVAKQHQMSKSAWTSEAGEIIEYTATPNVPPPAPWTPPQVLGDIWNMLNRLDAEFDNITQIWPVSEGSSSGATSGFQTNLLQEAADTVHTPEIRTLELAIEESCMKIRRLMKLGYSMPRLLSLAGPNYEPEVFEFANSQIDELADIQVEVGSALPTLKAAKQETVMNLYNSGLMGDVGDPEVRRRAMALLEMGSVEETYNLAKSDENQARWENVRFAQWVPGLPAPAGVDPATGQPLPAPPPTPPVESPHIWENHLLHYNAHTTWLKGPEGRNASPAQRRAVVVHTILHGKFINPQSALQIAQEEGIQELIPMLQALAAPPPAPAVPGAPPPPQGPQVPGPPAEQAPPLAPPQ